ncbi:MAG: nuclear transport factor 2 family protein [Candidatus Neomarinimicrobiota bacterium]|nr:nuclear transport factor 2 family protein [Candidatus Neomarinimicrobiota bacterium]MEC9007023.1 nuclear transport factor 2 family protein [Candidatus Neomarinimicrobiota bacterium]MEC9474705.1 nuclear transport factor 2 family protein [Candidatus Neomarinimicrobiota bacterium]MEE3302507.1 nuclear transport factor 2 family protein [Candidatus Neomarinimicrobiota bacterium]|tara:strand:- start:69 stop:536 length:468 start_codon:yes stop_codon:yes gene_type:complete
MKKMYILVSILLITSNLILASDKSEVVDVVNKHWEYQNKKNWKKFVGTLYSGGTMNGDSNGSFWYMQDATVAAVTEGQLPNNEFNFTPRYIEVDVLEKGKVAVAYYYLVGSYTINGVEKSDYRTRVSQIFVKEKGSWKVKSGHYTPLYSGSGIPN